MELDVELVPGPGVDKSQHYSPNCHSDAINSPSNSMIPSIELKLFDGAVCGQVVDDTHTASSVVTGGGDLGALLANDRSVVHHQLNHSTEEDECAGSSTTTMWGCHHCGLAMNGTEQQLHDHVSQCGLAQTVIHQGDDMEEEGAPHHLVTTAFDERAHHHDTLSTDHFTSTMLIAEDCDAAAAGLPPQPSVLCTEEDAGGGTHDVHTQQGDVSVGTKKSFVTSSDVRLVARYWKCSVCGVATQQGLASHLNSHSKDELIGALLALAEPVYHAADEVFLATSQTEATKSPEDDPDDVIPVFESSNNTITEYNNEQNGVSLTSCLETAPPQQHVVTISPPRHGKVSSDAWEKRTRNVVREVDANDNNMHRELTLRGVQVVKEICNYSNSDHSTVSTKPNTPSKPVHKKFTIINHKHSNVASVGGFQRQQAGGDTGAPASTVGVAPTASGRGGRGRRRGAPSRASGVQRQWSSRAPHPCPVCGKVLSSRGNVAKHITTHSTSKPWNCPPCGIGFNSQRDKQHHDQQYHSGGERGYVCSICGKAFAVRDTLREHLLFHDRKDKACDICGKMFWTQKCVTRHRKRHFPDKKHRCDMCPKTFAVKWDCTLHARKVHGVT